MNKINIKLMSEVTYATLKTNIKSYVHLFEENQKDGSWINTITSESAFEIKKYQIEDFELEIPLNYKDKEANLKNSIILYEHLKDLPGYILAEPRFWLWIMFEKGYETSLRSMEKIDDVSFKHQWLFSDGKRRGLFFGVLSRLYYRVDLTYSPENKNNPYYLTEYVMENPIRFREITWRTISNYRFVVKAMLKAELRVNKDIEFEEKGKYYSILAKEICKLGSIKFIDAMEDSDLENYIYERYYNIIIKDLEEQKLNKYNEAIDLMSTENLNNIRKAITIFKELNDFMDAEHMVISCHDKIKSLKSKGGLFSLLKIKKS